MNKTELLALIENGKNSGIEFKRDYLHPEQLAKEIVALANFNGGKILIGVDDDGIISGIQRDNLEEWVFDTIFEKVHPMIIPSYEEIPIDEQTRVAVITVGQGTTKPYVMRDRRRENIYIRVGTTSRLASREQQARLYALGGMVHAELLPVSGSGLADLSQDRLKHYLISIVEDKEPPIEQNEWNKRLQGLGFMHESDGHTHSPLCTIAGLVLFGHTPRRLQRQGGIRWMAFPGKEKDYGALDDQIVDGPLVALLNNFDEGKTILENGLFENLVTLIRPFLSEEKKEIDASMRRERHWFYPVEAIREALVNAVAHRDWTRNEEIEVVSYSNRLEIISPGSLPNSMTVEKMIAGQRSARNQLIVEVLRDYGYVDARGMGIRNKIIPLTRAYNGREPEFHVTEDYVKVVFHKGDISRDG
ncbi:MAG: putative DNA binding domain-containing protein [Rhodobacteraceae bacterium]|nr:putative DNA binding domain-containing protein [Paracoccaceae bacterium]